MCFIKLTSPVGDLAQYFNIDRISAVNESDETGVGSIIVSDGQKYPVKETVKEVFMLIQDLIKKPDPA